MCLQNDESRRFIFSHRWFPSPFSESYLQTGDQEKETERGPMTLKEDYAKFSKSFSGRVPDIAGSVCTVPGFPDGQARRLCRVNPA